LRAAVAVMNKAALDGTAGVQGLLQGVEHEGGLGAARHPPADDAAGEDVDDEGDVDEAGPSRDVGEVRHPKFVRSLGPELPVHVIARAGRGLVAHRRPLEATADGTLEPHLAHQPRHRAARDRDALVDCL